MPATRPPAGEIKVTVVPQTADLAGVLDIIARHAQACAAELRVARLPPVGYLFTGEPDRDAGVQL